MKGCDTMPNPAPANDLPRLKYYMEYWKIGDGADHIQTCEFHSALIDSFIEKFSGLGKYTVLYLICLSDGRILIDRRGTWNNQSLRSLLDAMNEVDQ